MTNIEQLKQERDEALARLRELEEQIERYSRLEFKLPLPNKGDKYWLISTYGNVIHYTYENDTIDKRHDKNGNIFLSRQEAENFDKFISNFILLYRLSQSRGVADWEDGDKVKHQLYYDYSTGKYGALSKHNCQTLPFTFNSWDEANAFIEQHKHLLDKFVGGKINE